MASTKKFWLLKAEPDSRIVKDKDVKFSVDDFEAIKITPWEGVRNYEARNLMKEMQVGDKALFYHSNCKTPGIAAFAEVSKEAYPDYTAWDITHPYFDPKTKQDNPKWFMVDLKFVSRASHFISLALLRHIADQSSSSPPSEIAYIEDDGVKAIKGMDLIVRGRLSVQRVDPKTWDVLNLMANRGGWDGMQLKGKKPAMGRDKVDSRKDAVQRSKKKHQVSDDGEDSSELSELTDDEHAFAASSALKIPPQSSTDAKGRKRKAEHVELEKPLRRSTRAKK